MHGPARIGLAALASASALALPIPAAAQSSAEPHSTAGGTTYTVGSSPQLVPWFYLDSGRSTWDRHRYYEDQANTVFTLAWNFVDLPGQSGYPDVLLVNYAQFVPPEGVPAPERRLALDSLRRKSLQLYVNYGDTPVQPGCSSTHRPGTFFISKGFFNNQTDPPVPDLGLAEHGISGTRAALGVVGIQLAPFTHFPVGPPEHVTAPASPNALYVTGSLGYALADIHPSDHVLATEARQDRLFIRHPSGEWVDESWRVPSSVLDTNNSGVVFVDLDGDGYMDLYVGRQGDNFQGAQNAILIYDPVSRNFFPGAPVSGPDGEPACATTEIAVADVNGDTYPDLVVANRMQRGGPAGPESTNYILLNDGTGVFSLVLLDQGESLDSRSVAVGDITGNGRPELVFGNAGSDGTSNELQIPPAEDHRIQIFFNIGAPGTVAYVDAYSQFINPGTELQVTAPQTLQVLLVDLFSPMSQGVGNWVPDGLLDLVIVNHRDILLNATSAASSVWILANQGAGSPRFSPAIAFPAMWGKTVAIADFVKIPATNLLDVFVGTGNRSSGVGSLLRKNIGNAPGGPWDLNFDTSYDLLPGTERGYGFDFADWTGDGIMDALLAARSYNYLVKGLLEGGGHANPHFDLTDSATSPKHLSNARNRMTSRGMEDGVFADFDGDGDLDAIVVGQRGGSQTAPCPGLDLKSAAEVVLENVGLSSGLHDVESVALHTPPTTVLVDAKIDINGRNGDFFPGIADRVVAADLTNNGRVDAIVHLFEIRPPNSGLVTYRVQPPHFDTANQVYSYGFRFLENIFGEPGSAGKWFRDVAPTNMLTIAGDFAPSWNRGLGMDVLADFDNNGALDLYTTTGFAQFALNMGGPPSGWQGVLLETKAQGNDLLFLNGVRGRPIGVLTETSIVKLPTPAADIVLDGPGDHIYHTAGSFAVAQGDLDNDGYADAVVVHYGLTGRTNFPWLLMNRFGDAPPGDRMFDEFLQRVDFTTFSDIIHTTPAKDQQGIVVHAPHEVMDDIEFVTLADIDGDGDLDIIFAVRNNTLRILRNKGEDLNGDGVIDAADGSPLGYFEDATHELTAWIKPTRGVNDMDVVDVDGDGDLDIMVYPFDDVPTMWRNDHPLDTRPRVAEIWPRIGAIRTRWVTMHGANFTGIDKVELRYRGGITSTLPSSHIDFISDGRARIYLPGSLPVGLAQVRVRRTFVPVGETEPVSLWNTQYKGYFVLHNQMTQFEGEPGPSGPP